MIEIDRVLDRLDRYLAEKDMESAERHLKYWISEVEQEGDKASLLPLQNELMGLYRTLGRREDCLSVADQVLNLIEKMRLADSPVLGTTLINAATGYGAFGYAEKAIPLFRRAQKIYEAVLSPEDGRLGALYNNMALSIGAMGALDEAEKLFAKALDVMAGVAGGEMEMAVTYCNRTNLYEEDETDSIIRQCLVEARALLNTEGLPRDSRYALTCEKCSSAFERFGQAEFAAELLGRAREIRRKLSESVFDD